VAKNIQATDRLQNCLGKNVQADAKDTRCGDVWEICDGRLYWRFHRFTVGCGSVDPHPTVKGWNRQYKLPSLSVRTSTFYNKMLWSSIIYLDKRGSFVNTHAICWLIGWLIKTPFTIDSIVNRSNYYTFRKILTGSVCVPKEPFACQFGIVFFTFLLDFRVMCPLVRLMESNGSVGRIDYNFA
jgi:hypothetical protein